MASVAEPGISPGSIPLADALVPDSIFAPDRGGCGDDTGDECFDDGDDINGELEDRRLDFTSKVKLGPVYHCASVLTLAAWAYQMNGTCSMCCPHTWLIDVAC